MDLSGEIWWKLWQGRAVKYLQLPTVKYIQIQTLKIDVGGGIHYLCSEPDELKRALISGNQGNIDVFYHLAWDGGTKNSNITIEQQLRNIRMSIQYLALAKQIGCRRFVGVGSVSENLVDQFPQERHPRVLYALTKEYIGKVLSCIADVPPKIEFVWCRLASIYGEYDVSNNLVNYTVNCLRSGISPEYTSAEQPYNFCHISDCVNALKAIGASAQTVDRPVFIGGPETAQLRVLLTKIQQIVAPDVPLRFGARPDDGITYREDWFSTSLLQNVFGYEPVCSIEKGIAGLNGNKEDSSV